MIHLHVKIPMVLHRIDPILDFWFGKPTVANTDYGKFRRMWFKKDAAFDALIREQFLVDYQSAVAGQYDTWQQSPRGCLALILLFDQMPRNMFRGSGQSFKTDPQALTVADHAIAQGFEQSLMPVERFFIYLPFEHSEALQHQHRCVSLFEALVDEVPELKHGLDYALRHRDVIAQFGRFPHRNSVLGRVSTPAEVEFLKQPGSRF